MFFIIAAFPAMAAVAPYHPVLHDPRDIVEATRDDTQVLFGAVLEVLVAISVAGTAVTLFPILRRQGEGSAAGYLVGRLLEAGLIVVGIISLVSIVSGAYDRMSTVAVVAALPVFAWEMSLAVWMIAKGFSPSPELDRPSRRPVDLGSPLATLLSY